MARNAQLLLRVLVWLTVLPLVVVLLVISGIGQPVQQIESQPDVRQHLENLKEKVSQLTNENAQLREEARLLFAEARSLVGLNGNLPSSDNNNQITENIKSKQEPADLPTVQHERLVRKVGIDVKELGYYVTSRLEMSAANLTELPNDINRMTKGTIDGLQQTLRQIKAYIRTTMVDLKSLSDPESDWRQKETEHLSKIVQEKIHQIMNPNDCEKKKKFICDLRANCGFGCQFHHVIYCMVTAVYHRRPIILLSSGWKYSGSGWQKVFHPISYSCQNVPFDDSRKWKGDEMDHDAIIPVAGNQAQERLRYLPLAIPEELAPRLTRLHGNPGVWWIGQMAKYLWKFQPQTSQYVQDVADRIGFKSPIVGIHVRRTDKLSAEASSHAIQEYMTWVDEYYNEREMTEKIDKRRVFIATDEPGVILRARSLYPHYEVLNDLDITKTAGTKQRYSPSSLLGIITDIELLARSDYLVCTFSSNVCRLAYELLQARHGDASQYFHSLDDIYYFGGQRAHYMHAIEHHVPDGPGEMRLTPGDKILIAGNHWNGYSKGKNPDGTVGLFPSYKVEDAVEVAAYPFNFLPPYEDTVTDPT